MTRFTDYDAGDDGAIKNIVVAGPGEDETTGTAYSRLSLALHSLKGGETIYLKDDIKIGFEAKLPDDVGEITIDGLGHTITRDTYVNPNSALQMISDEILTEILADPRIDPDLILMALEEASADGGDVPEEHYTGAILQVGAGDEVTLKNVTVDGEGNWEIDQAKLKTALEVNLDYDKNVLDYTGHPITEFPGNVVSTDSLIKVAGGTLNMDGVTLENFFAGDGYDDDRHLINFMSTEEGVLNVTGDGAVFLHNASRSGVCIGNTDFDEIYLGGGIFMEDN